MLSYLVSSLLDTDAPVVVHGVNARGAYAAGVAALVRTAWPAAYLAYAEAHAAGRLKLGAVIWAADHASGKVVGNCVTQATYGRTGRHIDYDALAVCLTEIARAARDGLPGTGVETGFRAVAMPLIGAGLAGGDWREIEPLIETELADLDVRIHVLRPEDVPSWRQPAVSRPG